MAAYLDDGYYLGSYPDLDIFLSSIHSVLAFLLSHLPYCSWKISFYWIPIPLIAFPIHPGDVQLCFFPVIPLLLVSPSFYLYLLSPSFIFEDTILPLFNDITRASYYLLSLSYVSYFSL